MDEKEPDRSNTWGRESEWQWWTRRAHYPWLQRHRISISIWKKILQILKRSLIWRHFWRPNSYFEIVFPLQSKLSLHEFQKNLSNSSSFISRSILWKLNLKSEFWSSCSHLVAGISSCPSFNFGPAPKAVLTLLSWLAIISANLGWLALAILTGNLGCWPNSA